MSLNRNFKKDQGYEKSREPRHANYEETKTTK